MSRCSRIVGSKDLNVVRKSMPSIKIMLVILVRAAVERSNALTQTSVFAVVDIYKARGLMTGSESVLYRI